MDAISLQLAPVPPAIQGVLDALTAPGHAAYLVGGCVRDLLRGAGVDDFDITTSATPGDVLALFPNAIPIGL